MTGLRKGEHGGGAQRGKRRSYAGAVVVGVQAAAGCALGTGAGTFLGGLASTFLGGAGAFGGAPIGCAVRAAGAVVEGLPVTIVSTLAAGGIVFALDKNSNGNTLNQDLQASSKIP